MDGIGEMRAVPGDRLHLARDRPDSVDLSAWIQTPITDQGLAPLCTAAVITTLAQYCATREARIEFVPSILFNYRLSRRLAGRPDRRGSTLEHAFAAWRRFGLIAEDRWPCRSDRIDVDPPLELLAAAEHRDVVYARLDGPQLEPAAYLDRLRGCLAAGTPTSIEFPLGPSVMSSLTDGVVSMPPADERCIGRHVVVLVGYDDDFRTGSETAGALRFRNNWGAGWGDKGHGWLPYEFVLTSTARQSWLVLESPWRDRDGENGR